jgi:hypothetical protein
MVDIVFIQNTDSCSWAVKDNNTGDTKGLIVERGCMEHDESPFLIYDASFINRSFEIAIYSNIDLTDVQQFLLNYFNNEVM